jgi:hypothetical protein
MRDRMSADEWLMSVMRGLTRWAGTDTDAARARAGRKPRGCLHPVFMAKLVVLLVVVVLMPLFMLPFLLIKIARFGVSGLRYSASVDMTSGGAARWGYGVLEAPARGGTSGTGWTRSATTTRASAWTG